MGASAVSAAAIAGVRAPSISAAVPGVLHRAHQGDMLKIMHRKPHRNLAGLDKLIGLDIAGAPGTGSGDEYQSTDPDRDCDDSKSDACAIGERS